MTTDGKTITVTMEIFHKAMEIFFFFDTSMADNTLHFHFFVPFTMKHYLCHCQSNICLHKKKR